MDMQRNGLETATDCGGGVCPRCANGLACLYGNDCVSTVCEGGVCVVPPVYTHPTVGLQSTAAGACMEDTCGGVYVDNGGTAGNYSANIPGTYRTFCPTSPGTCLQATFTSFSMNDTYFLCNGPNSCCDYLDILDGPTETAPALRSGCTSSPGTVVATNQSGCLTFRFLTDGSVQLAGWAANLSCAPCGSGPAAGTPADCPNATPVCANVSAAPSSLGPGLRSEACTGCAVTERFATWYRIKVATAGTLGVTVQSTPGRDMDVALFGPNTGCNNLPAPARCTAANGTGATGLGNGAMDPSEDAAGDGWVAPMPVNAGEEYYLLVNEREHSIQPYSITFTGSATLDCAL